MLKQFTIEPKNLATIDALLNIPVYQRPYCWEKEQIEKLLNDFKDNVNEDLYYIGNVIAIKNNNAFDLIDGQQRITTLWILCLYLSQFNKSCLDFCMKNQKSRLKFAIRRDTNEYLDRLLVINHSEYPKFWELNKQFIDENNNDQQNTNIKNAFEIISNWVSEQLRDKLFNINHFILFITKNVTFQFLIAPENIDENQLFIQINTNGTQFQHYDILKAKILNCLEDNEKTEYAQLWDHISLPYYTTTTPDKSIDNIVENKINLFDIIDNAHSLIYKEQEEKSSQTVDYRYEYIIDFNTLLIHSLFIYCKRYKLSLPNQFNTEKLLETFDSFQSLISKETAERATLAKNFLKILESVKQNLDQQFIFRDIQENEFILNPKDHQEHQKDSSIIDVSISEDKLQIAQLQRMLYHSNYDNKHYWLGIFLDQCINSIDPLEFSTFEKIDNILSIIGRTQSSYINYFSDELIFLTTPLLEIPINTFNYNNINRYWFYKLEYLLWKKSEDINKHKHIISRTSIEHILPQNDREYFKNNDINIDDFGNLILITVSENSGFSNKNLLEKYEYYKKLQNPPIKMKHFYNTLAEKELIKDKFSEEEIQSLKEFLDTNKNEMINLLSEHYKKE